MNYATCFAEEAKSASKQKKVIEQGELQTRQPIKLLLLNTFN